MIQGVLSFIPNLWKAQLSLLPKTGFRFLKKKTKTKYLQLIMFNIHLILLLNQLSKHMQVCQLSQAGLQCIHRLQLPEQQRPLRRESTAPGSTSKAAKYLPRWSNLWLQAVPIYAHTGLQKHQHHQPHQFHHQDTDREQQGGQKRVLNSFIKLNKALTTHMLVSKTQPSQEWASMGAELLAEQEIQVNTEKIYFPIWWWSTPWQEQHLPWTFIIIATCISDSTFAIPWQDTALYSLQIQTRLALLATLT